MGDPGAWCSWSQDRYTPLKPHLVKFYGIHLEGSGEMTQWLTVNSSVGCSYREPGFESQHLHSFSQSFGTLILGALNLLLDFVGTIYMWSIQVNAGKTHA